MQAQPRKRMRVDDGCNNNINGVQIKETETWSCSGNTSLMEPEILEDMGVGMLADGEASRESLKILKTQECTISPKKFEKERCPKISDSLCGTQESYKSASFERLPPVDEDRLDSFGSDDAVNYSTANYESGYSSRVEGDNLVECKETLNKEDSNEVADTAGIDPFLIYSRKKKPSVTGEDKFNTLSDEIILMILKRLPKKCLVRSMLVCKRWNRIARDEVLWTRLDLGGKVLNEGALGHVVPRGVQILRLAQAEIAHPAFFSNSDFYCENYTSKLQYLDLSMAVVLPEDLANLLSKCKYLKKLSLEKCTLNKACWEGISNNSDLEVLNLTMCEGMDIDCIKYIEKFTRLSALNVSWCSLDIESMDHLCNFLPSSVTRLNVAGCRKTLTDENINILVKRCKNLIELDISDCTMLTINTINCIVTLEQLEHLSLSRCYSIPSSVLFRLAMMPSLRFLDLFGLISKELLKSLRAEYTNVEINHFLYSSVARPTVHERRTSIWGLRVRD